MNSSESKYPFLLWSYLSWYGSVLIGEQAVPFGPNIIQDIGRGIPRSNMNMGEPEVPPPQFDPAAENNTPPLFPFLYLLVKHPHSPLAHTPFY